MICRPCQWPHHVLSLHLVWREHFYIGICPSRKSLSVCGDTSTELPCGGNRTNSLYATVLIIRVILLTSRPSVVDAIITAYESFDLPSSLGVRAHSSRGMVASKAFSSGVSMHDIYNAAGWSTPLTFVRFYNLDLEATPGSSVLSA